MTEDQPLDAPSLVPMIEGTARVVAVTGRNAVLETERKSSCGGCSSSKSCGVSSLADVFGNRTVRLSLPDDFGARVGELVVIGVPQSAVLRASLLAYLLPVVTVVVGGLIGAGAGGSNGAAAMGAAMGLAAGLLGAARIGPRAMAAERLRPVFLRKAGFVPEAGTCFDDGRARP